MSSVRSTADLRLDHQVEEADEELRDLIHPSLCLLSLGFPTPILFCFLCASSHIPATGGTGTPGWVPPQDFLSHPLYGWRGYVSADMDPVAEQHLDLVPPDLSSAQTVVPDTFSKEEDRDSSSF